MDQATPVSAAMPSTRAASETVDAAQLRRCLARLPTALAGSRGVRGDHDLNPGMIFPGEPRDAAVLVPLVDHGDRVSLIFTQRTAHLAAHAGQISFPGGHVEPGDLDAEATALREAEEEIGLDRSAVEPLGRLDLYLTRTGFRVTPVVAIVRPPFRLSPDPYEVAEAFEVPLSVIVDDRFPRQDSRELFGVQRLFYAFIYQHRYIWGATAGMLVNLRDVLREVL
jgi:8-oxo-dGTP pyrophosphatase MutT (NUDIX family)